MFTAYDPVKERIWIKGFDWPAAGLAEYDPINDTWTQRETGISSGYGHTGDIDPNRRLLVAAGEGSVWQWQIELEGDLAREVVETSGGASSVDENVFLYRLNPGGGVPPDTTSPAPPAGLEVQ